MKEILENRDLKEFPFNISDGYFASLEERVRERIKGEQVGKRSIWTILKPSFALAAAFIAVMAIGGIILKYSTNLVSEEEVIAENEQHIQDSLETLYFVGQLEKAMAEKINIEQAYNDAVMTISDPTESDDFNQIVEEYISQVPTSISNLLAEELYK